MANRCALVTTTTPFMRAHSPLSIQTCRRRAEDGAAHGAGAYEKASKLFCSLTTSNRLAGFPTPPGYELLA